jgi:hypothetical protein
MRRIEFTRRRGRDFLTQSMSGFSRTFLPARDHWWCKARHVESKPVIELFLGKVAWDGVVEAFELTGHPHAKRSYAWSYVDKGEPQCVTVLEIPPVDSAETAVKIAIVGKLREESRN